MNTMAIAHHFNHIVDLTADDDDWSPGDYYCTGRPQPYPLIPLSLELVMNGQSFRSTAPLFQFPLEVLTLIVEQIPSSCLKNLALVNSDCRQLARSRQFASTHFGCNKNTWAMLKLLHQEHLDHLDHQSSTDMTNSRYTLGSCIRRITFVLDQQLAHSRQPGQNEAMSNVEARFDLSGFEKRVTNSYRDLIRTILSGGLALPHLEVIHWGEGNSTIDQAMLTSFAASNAKHFKVTEFPFTVSGSQQWPLRTLIISPSHWPIDNIRTVAPNASMLSLCASTLETLFWMSDCQGGFDTSDLSFPKLRHLDLATAGGNNLPLSALFDAPLAALVMRPTPNGTNDVAMRTLLKRGSMDTLRELVWANYTPTHSLLVPFLKENSQITKLSFAGSSSKEFLGAVLPVLVSLFTNLTSLRLGSMGSTVPDSALEAISKIASLEQLCLSGSSAAPTLSPDPMWPSYRKRPEWYVDHASLRAHLCNLHHLRILAIINDTYRPTHNDFGSVVDSTDFNYYDAKWPGMDFLNALDIGDVKRYDLLFEKQHRERMIDEANIYAKVMPKLNWMYVGQYQMSVKGVGDARVATTFTEEGWPPRYERRSLPDRFLERTFGWEGSWKCWGELRGFAWSMPPM